MPRSAAQRQPLCPQCGRSEAVVAIAYGYPDPRLEKRAPSTVVAQAERSDADGSPAWFCRACELSFGEIGWAA